MRRWCFRIAWVLWAVIVLLVLLTHLFGQLFLPVAGLVYAPPQMWLISLVALALTGWWTDRRLTVVCGFTVLMFVGPFWGWRTHRPSVPSPALHGRDTLRVITVNRGDHHGHSIADFVKGMKPDLIAMQDSIYAHAWTPGAPEYASLTHQSRVSEFLLLSRHPITQTALLRTHLTTAQGRPRAVFKAARFQIDFHGQAVAVYNIHLPSPRQDMKRLAQQKSVNALDQMQQYWRDHATIIGDLMARVEAEALPTLVLGDWNQPTLGPYYRRLTHRLQDAHARAGLGFGWTFPGDWWTVFTDGQAWMRLDLVLCSKEWEVLRCEVEPECESQHCAVGAVVELR